MKLELNLFDKKKDEKTKNDDSIVLDKPLNQLPGPGLETTDEFESKIKEFEAGGHDEIKELAKKQTGPESPELIEKDKDPVHVYMDDVIEGKITEEEIKKEAKANCNNCFGRGHIGWQVINPEKRIPVVCKCILKKIKKRADEEKKDEKPDEKPVEKDVKKIRRTKGKKKNIK